MRDKTSKIQMLLNETSVLYVKPLTIFDRIDFLANCHINIFADTSSDTIATVSCVYYHK